MLALGMRLNIVLKILVLTLGLNVELTSWAQGPERGGIASEVNAVYAQSESLYRDIHQHPELSFHEVQTAAKLAAELRSIGYAVTTGVGRTGIVGVLRNGSGPVIMLRTELDALPIEERTGLAYASSVRTTDDSGAEVGVMHACGHDVHMAAWIGTARIMSSSRNRWRGTLVLIGQPAEEIGGGAAAMLADGLFTRFPKPSYAIAIHDDARFAAGDVGYHAGPILSNDDIVLITIFGRGGHGARPETTIDPILIASRIVVTLQSIVSRETSPFDPAVITVGSIHGGTRPNIIPDEVKLELTVRSFTHTVQEHLLDAIKRVAKQEAAAAGAVEEPRIENPERSYALTNDPHLTEQVLGELRLQLGDSHVRDMPPEMASEDFSEFERAGVPTLMLRIGAIEPAVLLDSQRLGKQLPSLHSALFAPAVQPTIKTAIEAEVIMLRTLMPAS